MTGHLRRLVAVIAIGVPICLSFVNGVQGGAPAQRSFASAEEAAAALAQAAASDNQRALSAIFGPGSETLLFSGDRIADQAQLRRFADAYATKRALVPRGPNQVELEVGSNGWPLPIPIVQTHGRWRFNAKAGAEEIINRRIGRDELSTIQVLLAFVEAQKDYFERTAQRTGTGVYAQRLISTPGRQDGLYWSTQAGEPESPFGPLVAEAQEEGYPGGHSGGRPIPYKGYYYRVLKAQGPNAVGGAKSYMRSGRMIGGYALLAWPAKYGASGIMSFQVGPDGVVFQRDLGPDTATAAARIQKFDPDLSWARITLSRH